MFEEFSAGYYLGRLYVSPREGEQAVMHEEHHEQANEQVYATLPSRDYGTNFGTVIADAYAVGAAANPDAYDLDPVAKANEIYETFVGEPVYDGVADAYGNGFGSML